MSSVGDHSPPGSALKALSNARRIQNADTTSMISDRSDSRSVRASIEDALDKLRSPGSSNNSLDEDREKRSLEKLVPKGILSKRRRKKEQREAEEIAKEEAARGRSIAERGTLEDDSNHSIKRKSSSADVDASSLLTYESDDES